MTDEIIPEPDPVPVPDVDPAPDPDPEPDPPHADERPSFVDEILNHFDETVGRLTPAPTDPNPDPLDTDPKPDESPVRKPWTHRNPFRKD